MEVDEALGKLGTVGRWQVIFFTILSIADMFPAAFHMYAINFVGGKPDHHCMVPPDTTLPIDDNNERSSCLMYVNYAINNDTTECTNGWKYYLDDIGPTIVSQWDLVCGRAYLKDMSQTIMIWGVMVGAMAFTALSDNIGRKPVFLFSQWAIVVVGVITAFVDNYYVFACLRFITGALQQGIILTGFVMACELFAAKYRTFAGIMIENFWAIACFIIALIAYLIRNWRYYQLTISLLGLFSIPLYWILPESVPWLCANNRYAEAEEIIRNAAKMNNIEMPKEILTIPGGRGNMDTSQIDQGILAKLKRLKPVKKDKGTGDSAQYTLLDVFRNRRLTIYAVVITTLWLVTTLVYYGLGLSTSSLAGDRYLNFFLMNGVVEIPAYTISYFFIQKWGRRWPLIIFLIVCGVSLILTQLVPERVGEVELQPLRFTFYLIGKFAITAVFGIVFLYAPEIFPTTVRSQALGIASVGGRIGNMMAPFASFVAERVPWLPGPLFGVLSIAGGLLALLLPETLNRPLPQTIADIEAWSTQPPSGKTKEENGQEMSATKKNLPASNVVC